MTQITQETTGPYAHDAGATEEVRFASQGDVERSFTIILADHATQEPENPNKRGIAILDNDNAEVVLDGMTGPGGPDSPAMQFRFAHICAMDWAEFSAMCRENERYRGGIADLDDAFPIPAEGNPYRQAALGLRLPPEKDTRSEFVRALSEDPEVPYTFPANGREGMTEEICRHLMFIERGGLKNHIAWDIRMNFSWNRTGRIRGGTPVDGGHDYNWRHMVETEPDVTRMAASEALAPYLESACFVLDMEEFPCRFELAGRNKGFLTLKTFCGNHMSATRDVSIEDRLLRLNDAQLEGLWVVCRVLDEDLSRENRTQEMSHQMHLLRMRFDKGDALIEE